MAKVKPVETYSAEEYAKKSKTKVVSQVEIQKSRKAPSEGIVAKAGKKRKEVKAK